MRHAYLTLLVSACATLPAATWTGGGDGVAWTDTANWSDGAPPSAEDAVWDIGEGWCVQLDGQAPGDHVVKEGQGTLRWADGATAESIEVRQGTLEVLGRSVGPCIQLTGGRVSGDFIRSPIEATGGTVGGYIWGTLTLTGGAVTFEAAGAGYGVMMSDASVRGHLIAESAIWFAPGAPSSRIEGLVEMSASSSLNWLMQDSFVVSPLVVTGQLTSIYSETWIYFSSVDWSQPFWDKPREFLFVDAQEGGIVTTNLIADPYAGNEDRGLWSRVPAEDGDIILRWTPLASAAGGVAAIPEASTALWALAMTGGMIFGRMARRRIGRCFGNQGRPETCHARHPSPPVAQRGTRGMCQRSPVAGSAHGCIARRATVPT